MAAVHLTTIPCEPNTAYNAQRKPIFLQYLSQDVVQPRFEDFITFLYVFMNVAKVFVRQELWVNVPVAIFFPTED